MDLPEAAGGRLAQRAGPAGPGPGAGVGPGPVGLDRGDLQLRGRGGGAGRPAELGGRSLAQGRLGRGRGPGAGLHALTGDLGVVEVLLPLGLVRAAAAGVGKRQTPP